MLPLVDIQAEWRAHGDEYRECFDRVGTRGHFILGPEVAAFEAAFAQYCGTRFAIGVGSGTDALALLLRAIDVGPGDDVIVPALTFPATAEAVLHVGARPVFADVDRRTGLMSPDHAAAVATDDTRVVIPVHLYGFTADIAAFKGWAQDRDIVVLEDAAQAHGADVGEARAGSVGRGAAFSFYPAKNLGAFGDAGAVVTSDPAIDARVRSLRDHGRVGKHEHREIGMSSRLDEVNAAILAAKLARLDDDNAARRRHAARYGELLTPDVAVVGWPFPPGAVNHVLGVEVDDRDRLQAELQQGGIGAGVHYPRTVPEHPAFGAHDPEQWPNSYELSRRELSLPMHPYLEDDQIAFVVDRLRSLLADS